MQTNMTKEEDIYNGLDTKANNINIKRYQSREVAVVDKAMTTAPSQSTAVC